MRYNLIWFKRDLRLHDHAALYQAALTNPVVCLYIIEPSLWAQEDAANQHYQFIIESLRDLRTELESHGGYLCVVTGEVLDVLSHLYRHLPFDGLFSHEETGNGLSYKRDKAVANWCLTHGIPWQEFPQFGVIRRLKNRDLWKAHWDAHVQAACWSVPKIQFLPAAIVETVLPRRPLPSPTKLQLAAYQPPLRQRGGRSVAKVVLDEFLSSRSGQYRGGISSPLSAPTACSRLSPYLAYGCLSLREVVQATRAKLTTIAANDSLQKLGLNAFISRLYWHCHFIQKLESEPTLEFSNLHPGYDGLREQDWNQARFETLIAGRTGWPMVDASVAMLRETGWINFRMRAMLVSVATYPLWLHWRPVGLWLARQFLDYEPGIHWSQLQMQAGTTGINTARVYNPIKQAQDHDPQGYFVRRWLPAMRKVPDTWLFEPWRMPHDLQLRHGISVGSEIPTPIVDLQEATREAKKKLFALRTQAEVKSAKAAIVAKHGSRKRSHVKSMTENRLTQDKQPQMTLEF